MPYLLLTLLSLALLLLAAGVRPRHRVRPRLLGHAAVAALLLAAATLAACGGGGSGGGVSGGSHASTGTPAGTYTLTVLTLTVQ